MRRTLLVSAALFSAAVAALAVAQTPLTSPTEPGSSETVAPAPNGEPAGGQPAEGATSGGATPGGTINTEAKPAGPAASGPISEPAPGGTTEEHATSSPVNNKQVEHGPPAAERHPQRHVAHPLGPEAKHASAIERPHRHPPTAPHQTASPAAEENASTDQYLHDAQTALRERRIGEAQEALERAETRALDSGNTDAGPNSTVNRIERARDALGHVRYLRPDPAQAGQLIDQALSDTASNKTSSLSDGQ
jgi:hypothetical protein